MPVPFQKRKRDELLLKAKGILSSLGIGNIYEGGKAKALVDSFMEVIADLEDLTYTGLQNVNLSTATGIFLDLLANSVGVQRILAEDDNSLRQRVQYELINRQMCNEIAIATKLLQHPRIRDVAFQDFVYGSGSFAIFIDPIEGTSVDQELIDDVHVLLDNVVAKGTKVSVVPVQTLPIRITVLVRGENISSAQATSALERYVAGLKRGEGFSIDTATAAIVNAGASSVEFKEIMIDNQRVLAKNYAAQWNQRIVLDSTVDRPIQVIVSRT